MTASDGPVVVVGAGVAGLACAARLARSGRAVAVLEATDRVGGRVGGHLADGYVLDHGFQVFLDRYPDVAPILDVDALDLRPFEPGALIFCAGRLHRLADPHRRPLAALRGLTAPTFRISDVVALGRLRRRALAGSPADLLAVEQRSAIDELRRAGLSERIIERFFRPFFGGVFFDRELATSNRMLLFTFRMFATGAATLPARGMQAIPAALARLLPSGAVRLGARVRRIDGRAVVLDSGERIESGGIVLAAAREIEGGPPLPPRRWRRTITLAYEAAESPVSGGWLALDGEGRGPVNHLAVPSNVAPGYAPDGRALVYANVVGSRSEDDDALDGVVRRQLGSWFGERTVAAWRRLAVLRIDRALPDQSPVAFEAAERWSSAGDAVVCGDALEEASINGAIRSGLEAADAVLARRG